MTDLAENTPVAAVLGFLMARCPKCNDFPRSAAVPDALSPEQLQRLATRARVFNESLFKHGICPDCVAKLAAKLAQVESRVRSQGGWWGIETSNLTLTLTLAPLLPTPGQVLSYSGVILISPTGEGFSTKGIVPTGSSRGSTDSALEAQRHAQGAKVVGPVPTSSVEETMTAIAETRARLVEVLDALPKYPS